MRRSPVQRLVLFSVCVAALGAVVPAACKKKEDPAARAARQSLEEIKVQVTKLRKDASDLRARFNALPEDLPNLETVRSKLLAVEEVLGIEGARVEWLAGELGTAVTLGSKEQVAKISETIRSSVEGSQRLAKPVVELAKELSAFERVAPNRDAGSGSGG
jgi:uncharacterized protein YoxC